VSQQSTSTEAFVDEAAAIAGLRMSAEQRPGVITAFCVLRDAAASLDSFPLPSDAQPVVAFTPHGISA
jgi:hypothetical protein